MTLLQRFFGVALLVALAPLLGGPSPQQAWLPTSPPRPAREDELREARANRDEDLAHLSDSKLASSFDLQFLPRVLDFGEMYPGVSQRRIVRLFNVGGSPIEVTRAVPGSSGTGFPWPTEPIPPNWVAEMAIPLKPPERQGIELHKKVTFQMSDRWPRTLDLRARVAETIRAVPDVIQAPDSFPPSPIANDTLTREPVTALMLVALDGVPFHVRTLTPQIASLPNTASFVQILPLDPATCDVLAVASMISMTTDHPRGSTCVALVLCHASSPDAP